PYEPKELKKFLNNLPLKFDEKMVQIYLNGMHSNESMNILNSFLVKNQLKIVHNYESFNYYPCKSTDLKYIESLRKQIMLDFDFKLDKKLLRKLKITSDLLIIENTNNNN
ncbi:MAG: hypothetical protein ACFE96_14605, partial [Candidatus Hermodarchaeota archaeon]